MTEDRFIVTKRGVYAIPEDQDGTPMEELYPGIELPRILQGAKIHQTPRGPVIVRRETQETGDDKGPDKPVVFRSRDEQIRRRDAEFYARPERAYEKVRITALPAQSPGDNRSDIQRPDIAAAEVRVRLMRHFPEGPGMAAVAQQAGNRYDKALGKWLQKDGAHKPGMSELARRWRLFCREHASAERDYYAAGYRPALVNPAAIDFSAVKLSGRERKAALIDRGVRLKRTDDLER
jgi:hypothetical protein